MEELCLRSSLSLLINLNDYNRYVISLLHFSFNLFPSFDQCGFCMSV
jgi:hypothetical protein